MQIRLGHRMYTSVTSAVHIHASTYAMSMIIVVLYIVASIKTTMIVNGIGMGLETQPFGLNPWNLLTIILFTVEEELLN